MSATTEINPVTQEWFLRLGSADQVRFLLHLAHELTITARCFYVPQADGLTNPEAVRHLNEIQHRVSAHARDILDDPAAGEHPPAYGWLTDCPPRGGLPELVEYAAYRAASYLRSEARE